MKENEKANCPGNQNGSASFGDAPILIDGSNVVMANQHYKWRVLKTLLDWLKNNGREYFLYFDANILYKVEDDAGQQFVKDQLRDKEHTFRCGAGYQADNYILLHANKTGNHIISNDNYKEYVGAYKWLAEKRDRRRVHKFHVTGGLLMIPELHLAEEIYTDANDAVNSHSEKIETYDKSNIDKCKSTIAEWRQAAEQGDKQAYFVLGILYSIGVGIKDVGITKDKAKAVELFRKAADQGHAEAQCWLGQCYYNGEGVAKDFGEAVKWYCKAANQGCKEAQHNLGACYSKGEGVRKDVCEAAKWYRKAAEHGLARSQRDLAICYCMGTGVDKDLEEAEKWWRRMIEQGDGCAKSKLEKISDAADDGDATAQYRLGVFFLKDEFVDSKSQLPSGNLWLAAKWFRKAAEQGHTMAQCKLAELCAEGFFTGDEVMDNTEAAKWYRKAAEQGCADAQYKLGECYLCGIGLDKDNEEAKKWFRKATENGFEEAMQTILG